MGFLRRITRQGAVRKKDGAWRQVSADTAPEKAGTQPLGTYIDRRQATVAEWVVLHPILEFCERETGYKVGERLREPWWRKLGATLKDISAAARERRWKYGRRGKIGGGDRDT